MNLTKIWKINITCAVITASISFISSSIMAIMVLRSKTPNAGAAGSTSLTLMSSAYHRIVFGLSISDVLQSAALLLGPFVAPADVPQALWGVGNNFTCKVDGVMFTLGSCSTPMYILFLCYYSLCRIKKGTGANDAFGQNVEKMLHSFIITFTVLVCVAAFVTRSLNSYTSGSFCTVSAVPTGCRQKPEIWGECDESIAKHAGILSIACFLVLPFLCLVGITTCMAKIHWHVVTRTMIFQGSAKNTTRPSSRRMGTALTSLRSSRSTSKRPRIIATNTGGTASREEEELVCIQGTRKNKDIDLESNPSESDHEILSQEITETQAQLDQPDSSVDLARIYRREIVIQACLYVLAFLVTYIFPWSISVANVIFQRTVSFWWSSITAVFYPLSGFFNILVYTRPKVVSLRIRHPEYSWPQAFVMAVRAGWGVIIVEEDSPSSLPSNEDSGIAFPSSRDTFSLGYRQVVSSAGVMNNYSDPVGATEYKYYTVPDNR